MTDSADSDTGRAGTAARLDAPGPVEELDVAPDSERIADALLGWYQNRARDVPWRGESDPYRILVAEVMAQQTRMATVRERYGDFVRRFPDVATLAAAEPHEVLKAWEGLGYYARARNLHRAARRVMEEHDGSVPRERTALEALPGVGRYTAGAVASLAFDQPEPAVDGNARRVLARLFDLERPTPARLDGLARKLVESAPGRAAELNQALMDLGGTICVPAAPKCRRCPVAPACLARARGTVAERPPPRKRRPLPHHDIAVGLVRRRGRILIQRRPPAGLLGGLWEFPGGKVEAGERPQEAVRRELREELEVEVEVGGRIASVDHAYSHFRITLHAYWCRLLAGEPRPRSATDIAWATPEEIDAYAFPSANRRILEALPAAGG